MANLFGGQCGSSPTEASPLADGHEDDRLFGHVNVVDGGLLPFL